MQDENIHNDIHEIEMYQERQEEGYASKRDTAHISILIRASHQLAAAYDELKLDLMAAKNKIMYMKKEIRNLKAENERLKKQMIIH